MAGYRVNFTFVQRLQEYEIRRLLYIVVSGYSIQGKYERHRNQYCCKYYYMRLNRAILLSLLYECTILLGLHIGINIVLAELAPHALYFIMMYVDLTNILILIPTCSEKYKWFIINMLSKFSFFNINHSARSRTSQWTTADTLKKTMNPI